MIQGYYKDACKYYRSLHIAGAAYVIAVSAEAYYCSVPWAQYSAVMLAMLLVLVKCMFLLMGMGAFVYVRAFFAATGAFAEKKKQARAVFSNAYNTFLDGEVFAYGCAGVPVLFAIDFFFIQKSLILFINPYHWDPVFAAWDKLIHFGHYPHEFMLATAGRVPAIGFFFDVCYYLWFVVLYLGIGYNLFMDTDRKRRLQFFWVFFLSWTVIGSLLATWLSSVGPLFFHDFYPKLPDPYAALVAHFDKAGPTDFRIAHKARELLLYWSSNGRKVNLNALSAMPSMHVAIAWLMVLYARGISRKWFYAACGFCATIFMASVYFGFHFAVDGYVSIVLVSLMWWGVGKALGPAYQDASPLKRQ